MTLIVGNVVDVGLAGVDGTLRVWAGYRPEEVGLIAPVRRVWDVKAGELPGDVDVTPGPAMVQFNFGMDATAEFPVVVPDVAQVTIQDLLLLHFAVDPFPVQEVMRDRLAAEAAAQTAADMAAQTQIDALTLAQRVDTGTRQVSWTSDGRPYLDKTATVGVPLRMDTTVGTRVFLGDVMIYGDTGDRDMTDLLPEGWSATTFRLRRVGQLVTIAIVELKTDVSSGTASLRDFIPSGYLPTPRHMFPIAGANYVQINTAGGMAFISADGGNIQGVITFHTHKNWPTELPGVPGPGSSVV